VRIKYIIFLLLCGFYFVTAGIQQLHATHLMGGSMTYQYIGVSGPNLQYRVTLKIYRYCDASGGGTAGLDASMFLGIYNEDAANPFADKVWFATENLPLISSSFITPPTIGSNCPFSTTVCVEEGIFRGDIFLPPSADGYHLMVERCCRNGNIMNLSTPGSVGQTYYCFIPPNPVINSTPQFSDIPVPYICTGDTITIVNNAFDPDGDSLAYSFEIPYAGYSSQFNPVPDPQIDNNPYIWGIPNVLYNGGYSMPSPFGPGGYVSIDPLNGLTKYYIPNQGFFVVAIEIREYRNGVLISSVRRDLQLIAIACPPNAVPLLSNINGAGQTNFTVTEGQTLCFPVSFIDPDGDSLYLTSSGIVFNSSVVNPPASLANANGDGFVTSQFCWSTECGMAQAAPYQFVATVTDNGCPPKISNQIYSITVNPSPLPPAPAVNIIQDPPGSICTGTAVTFTAIPTFGGTSPVYQWQVNGVNVGGNSNTYTSSTLVNGDVITVSMTSNSVCVSTFNAVSPPVVMVVNPFAAPQVSIAAVPAGPICSGTNVTFTASPVNPGPTPVYQWMVSGVAVGGNSPTYSSSTLVMNNQVSVTLTSDPACPPAVSNIINMVVNPVLTPSVQIVSSVNGPICIGQMVTFTAYPTAGGTTPTYQWQVNGVNVGGNSNTFSSNTLNDGDVVTVILTSVETCVTTPTAVSNAIIMSVTAGTPPAVSITASPVGPICAGDNIIFTATPVAGGASPTYQWFVNGVFTGFTGSVYATSTLTNNAQVSVTLTSSLTCSSPNTANSNVIIVTVNPLSTLTANIAMNPSGPVCPGTLITFTANVVNGGSNPFFQWQVNGVNAGVNSPTYSGSGFQDMDVVRVIVTTNLPCTAPVNTMSNLINVALLPTVTPTVSITPNPAGPVCQGTNVTFTANSTFGGAGPIYQWFVNGVNTGSTGSSFSSSTLNNGDLVQAQMTSNAQCPVPAVVSSNQVVMAVTAPVVPTANISVSPVFPVCAGTPVTFSSVITNGGTLPVYQWLVNGVPTGINASTFSPVALNNGDVVSLQLTSNATCATPASVISNNIVSGILPYLSPAVSINAQPGLTVCAGTPVTFTANGINGGASPSYQWFVNNNPAGLNSPVFTATFNDGDNVNVVYTSNYQCLTDPDDTSNTLTVTVNPNLTPSVSIMVNPVGPVCPGDLLSFTATPVNGGTTPVYAWTVNGIPAGSNNPVFSSTGLQNGDFVRVTMTSSEVCLTAPSANSNTIMVIVSPNIAPDVTISVSPPFPVCDGDTVTFSSVYTGSGSTPGFDWRVNGVSTGATGPTWTTNTLSHNDLVDVVLASSAFCALPTTDTSNVIQAVIDPLLTPVATIIADPAGTFCDGQTITYSATGIFGGINPGYQWLLNGIPVGTNNDTLISSTFQNSDSLQIVYTSNERCLAINPVLSNLLIIDRLPPLSPQIIAPDEICFGTEVNLSVTGTGGTGGPYYYSWDNGLGNGTTYQFIPGQTATYTVMMDDSCSTPRSATKTIIVHPLPDPAFAIMPPSSTILSPYFEFINQSQNSSTWLWQFGDGINSTLQHPDHEYSGHGYYQVTLISTSNEGCVDSIMKPLFVEDVITFYVPNSFTPNNDGVNDEFGVVGNSISGYNMTIYGRWGQQVFNSAAPFDKWDGRDENGNEVPDGVYVYSLKVFNDPKRKTYTGTVTLIR
jgi:gliding motility-associated-like protein